MKIKKPFILAALGAIGFLSGTALAVPTFTGGVQTPLPVAQPAVATYGMAIVVTPADTILDVHLGRDNTTPYASINIAFFTPIPIVGPFGQFTYRPLWDAPLLPSPVGPNVANFQAHWLAADIFARAARDLREATRYTRPASLVCYIDPAIVGTPALSALEFYKYDVTF